MRASRVDSFISFREFTWSALLKASLQIAGFAALTGLCAHAKFFLPFTPVPITLQTLAVVLAGAMLGPYKGALSQMALIAAGLIGLPVFAQASVVTGGYLLGFILAAFVAGWIFQYSKPKSFFLKFNLLFIASLFIFLPGVIWLKTFTGMSFSKAARIKPRR